MHHFRLKGGRLYAEGIPVSKLAGMYGTPLYVYSATTITDHYDRLTQALAPLDHLICFALKANSNLAVLKLLAERGGGFDLVSGGELTRVLKAGGDAAKCSFAGVGKTRAEIEQALAANVYVFNAESAAELEFINRIAGEKKVRAPVAVRVNPNVDAGTHAKITTGTYENKFGIAFEEVGALYARVVRLENLRLLGVQMHIGSQITETRPFVQAVKKMLPLVAELKARHKIEFFDIGGGLGIVYQPALASAGPEWWSKQKKRPLTPADYGEELVPLLKPLGLRILVEPGRFLVGNAGVLVTEVLYVKKTGRKTFVIVDAAMNDLIRPAFYDSYHEIVPLTQKRGGKLVPSDVVGPICESGDYFAKDRLLPPLRSGDRLALLSAGAYGFVMASNYNTRPRPAEVLVKGAHHRIVRRRETVEDLLSGETV
ncbi:MAG TPA: diaminopimelate decarboxylase [Candidatus Methylacidiphilales bacterium]|nr:diaminopimelate decarboxylase [Candidatus Methylacidiphilales bacterium]